MFSLYTGLSSRTAISRDDATSYWLIAKQFTEHGHFSLLTFHQPLRGYSFPLLLNGFQHLGSATHTDALLLFRLFSAVEWSLLLAVILPTVFQRLLQVRLSLISIALFCGLCFTFWHGHMLFTLTDSFSLFFMTLGVLLLTQAAPPCASDRVRAWVPFAVGLCLALAANARPVYQVTLVFATLFLLWRVARRLPGSSRAGASLALFLCGAALALFPQSIINQHNLGKLSPFANNVHLAGHPGLYAEQLGWGVLIQRYETIVDGTTHQAKQGVFLDERGTKIRHWKSDPTNPANYLRSKPLTYGQYAKLVAHHPVFFAGAYARHLFNGLDTAYPTPYPSRIYPRNALFAMLTFLMLALALLRLGVVLHRSRAQFDMRRAALVVIFALPALIAIPTAIETRFLLPISMLLLGMALFRPAAASRNERMFPRARYSVPVMTVVVIISFLTATSTFQHVVGEPHTSTWCAVNC